MPKVQALEIRFYRILRWHLRNWCCTKRHQTVKRSLATEVFDGELVIHLTVQWDYDQNRSWEWCWREGLINRIMSRKYNIRTDEEQSYIYASLKYAIYITKPSNICSIKIQKKYNDIHQLYCCQCQSGRIICLKVQHKSHRHKNTTQRHPK